MMNNEIQLGFMENSEAWCNAWTCALEIGASVESAEISATLAQWAYRDLLEGGKQ
jgi:hypothetical protein